MKKVSANDQHPSFDELPAAVAVGDALTNANVNETIASIDRGPLARGPWLNTYNRENNSEVI
jgi:hypothetical protein